jgi:hypothetical protein
VTPQLLLHPPLACSINPRLKPPCTPSAPSKLAALSGSTLNPKSQAGNGGSMAEAALSASASPASWPLDAPRSSKPAFRCAAVEHEEH